MKWVSGSQRIPISKFGHKNIVRGVSDWKDKTGCRDFNTIDEMNDALVAGINDNVKAGDILFHLGDWSFGGTDYVLIRMFRLDPGIDIHLVLGNHDKHIRNNKQLVAKPSNGFGYETNAQDLFTSVSNYLEVSIDKQSIVMSHYPMISWNSSYRGSWMLHGHAHNTTFKKENHNHWYHKAKILDVGVDAAFAIFGEYRPFSFEEIKKIMKKRDFISTDHHDLNTDK